MEKLESLVVLQAKRVRVGGFWVGGAYRLGWLGTLPSARWTDPTALYMAPCLTHGLPLKPLLIV